MYLFVVVDVVVDFSFFSFLLKKKMMVNVFRRQADRGRHGRAAIEARREDESLKSPGMNCLIYFNETAAAAAAAAAATTTTSQMKRQIQNEIVLDM